MKYYPVFLDLRDRKAVVVGGGRVAERKVRSLLTAGATVEVISPRLTSYLRDLRRADRIRCRLRNYRGGDLKDAFLVFACTSSVEVNTRVAGDAAHLVNVVDMSSEGNFIVPSVVRRGPLIMTVSTGGASPALARAIRKDLQQLYGEEFSRYVRFLNTVRRAAMRSVPQSHRRRRFLSSVASEEMIQRLRKKGFKAVRQRVLSTLQSFS